MAGVFTSVGIVIGFNQVSLQKRNIIYNSAAPTKKIKTEQAPERPKPVPEQQLQQDEKDKTKPEIKPLDHQPDNSARGLEDPNQGLGQGIGDRSKELTTEEVIRMFSDPTGEKSKTFSNPHGKFPRQGGVGTHSRGSGLNKNIGKISKWTYDEFNQGAQDSAATLGRLIKQKGNLTNIPYLAKGQKISLNDLKNLQENSLRLRVGQKILNLTEADKVDIIKELNNNVAVSDIYGHTIRGSLQDLVNLSTTLQKIDNYEQLKGDDKGNVDTLISYFIRYTNEDQIPNGPPKYIVPNKNIAEYRELYEGVQIPDYTKNLTTAQEEYKAIKQLLTKVRLVQVSDLTLQDIDSLEQGYMPTIIRLNGKFNNVTWQARPAFVNEVQYQRTYDNVARFLPITSNWERSQDDIINLNFRPDDREGITGFDKTVLKIPGYDDVAELFKYTSRIEPNNKTANRYIINITGINKLASKSSNQNTPQALIDAAIQQTDLKKVGDEGIGVAIQNINATTGNASADFVTKMPGNVKSLTLFYNWNNPKVANAILFNQNYGSQNKLTELNLYTNITGQKISSRNNDVDTPNTLTRIDPRVYQRVVGNAYDYKYNAIFNTMDIAPNTTRKQISDIFNLVYIQGSNMRVYQGSFGGTGAYPTQWWFGDNNQWDFNNIVIPKIPNFAKGKFNRITYSPLVNQIAAPLDLENLQIDNTDKIDYELGNTSKGVFYADTAPAGINSQNYVRVIGHSKFGHSQDLQSILNYVNAGWQYIRNIDLRDYMANGVKYTTGFDEATIKSTSWPVTIRYVYYTDANGNDQAYKNPNANTREIGDGPAAIPSNTADVFKLTALGDTSIDNTRSISPTKTGNADATTFDSPITKTTPLAEGKNHQRFISTDTSDYDAVKNDTYKKLNDYTSRIVFHTNVVSINPLTGQPRYRNNNPNDPVYEDVYGTAWILDYQKTNNNNEYPTTWYYGTNLHVVALINRKGGNHLTGRETAFIRNSSDGKDWNQTELKGTNYPEVVYTATNFLENGNSTITVNSQNGTSRTITNYFKDFAVIKITYSSQEEAKKATNNFAQKTEYNNSVFTFATPQNSLLKNKTGDDLSGDDQNYSLGYPADGDPLKGGSNSITGHAAVNQRVGTIDNTKGQGFANVPGYQYQNNYNQTIPGIYDINKIPLGQAETLTWDNVSYHRFNTVYGLNNSGFAGGGSGSLVVNQNGQVVGIYWGNADSTQTGFVDPLVSPNVIQNGKKIIQGYDLINGGVEGQKGSFKEYLQTHNLLTNSWLFSGK